MKNLIIFLILIGFIACESRDEQNVQFLPEAVELNDRAVQLLSLSKEDSALILFDQAIKIDENYFIPHFNKIGVYLGEEDFDKALYESEMVIKKIEDSPESWFLAGLLNEHQGNEEKALIYYKTSVQIFTDRIEDGGIKADINADKLNRALSKKFLGDQSYVEDFNELEKVDNYKGLVEQFKVKSREEILKDFFN
ncbi:tetratricopeptide repeat protein [Echinicola shivajiensis]|uniref:tetratricopeptide repeat protein n=1 Tax=Echinicola shivajiensis TaxID=1035916 RepID=UPI001BFCCC75|nr:hypothetical protein [Echinicola shivajiensis]